MKSIQRQAATIPVASIVKGQASGTQLGREAFAWLDGQIRAANADVVGLDFKGVELVDASWSREAIGNLVARYRGEVGLFIMDANEVVEENIDAAFARMGLTILSRHGEDQHKPLGHQVKEHLGTVLEIVEDRGEVTTTEVIEAMPDLTLQNCNNRLRQLWEAGLVARREGTAPGGGKSYVYRSVS